MKFAKRLQAEAVPEWRSKYLQYKQLKKLIKSMRGERDPRKKSTIIDLGGNYIVQFTESEQTFLQSLDAELIKIEEFYQTREQEAIDKKVKIMNQLNLLPDYQGSTRGSSPFTEPPSPGVESRSTWPPRRPPIIFDERDTPPTLVSPPVSKTTTITAAERLKIASLRRASFNHLAKQRIRKALLEFYRSLDLLRNFKMLNMLAVNKILKKFDKISGRFMTQVYAERLRGLKFYTNETVDSLMADVENVFRYVFTGGDRSKALRKLRLRDLRNKTFHSSGFLAGMLLTACLALTIRLIMLVVDTEDTTVKVLGLVYFGLGLPFLMGWLFAINAAIWESNYINYRFIFEFNQRTVLHNCQFCSLMGGYFLFYLLLVAISLGGALDRFVAPFLQPWLVLLFLALFFMLPTRFPYRSTRMWFARVFTRIFTAPYYPCRFKDFFINDQYMSLVGTFDVVGRLLYFSLNQKWVAEPYVKPVAWYVFIPPFLPAFWRSMQCIRRYNDSKLGFPHLANLAKYCTSLLVVILDGLLWCMKANFLWHLLLMARIVSALFSLGWDIVMDFGLWQRSQINDRLRGTIFFRPWVYWYLMISDTIARFLWIAPLLHSSVFPNFPGVVLTLILWVVEVLRRFQWNIFRVEYEHVNNCNMLRAVADVQLPYMAADLFYQDMVETIQQHQSDISPSADGTSPGSSLEEAPLITGSSSPDDNDDSDNVDGDDEIETLDTGEAISQLDPAEVSMVQKTAPDATFGPSAMMEERFRSISSPTTTTTAGPRLFTASCFTSTRRPT